jgi:hypothetical protein
MIHDRASRIKTYSVTLLALLVLANINMVVADELRVPGDFMWGINIFHPFSIPDMHAVGEYEPQTPSVLTENHLAWVRFNIKWRDLMPPEKWGQIPSQDDPLWGPYDSMISGLAEKNVGLLAIVACGQFDMVSRNPGDVGPDEYIRVAGQLTKAIVERYKTKVSIWQIENEVNAWAGHASIFFRFREITDPYWANPSQAQFRDRLLDALYQSVKEADGKAIVTVAIHYGAWSGEIFGFKDDYIPQNYDLLGVTLYSHYMNIVPPILSPEQVANDYVEKAVQFSVENRRPVVVLETGFPSGDFGVRRNEYWTEEGQSRFVSAFVDGAALQSDIIKGIFFYHYRDTNQPGFAVSIGSQAQEDFFGFVDYQGRPKLSWQAYGQKITEYTPAPTIVTLTPYLYAAIALGAVFSVVAIVLLTRKRRRQVPRAMPFHSPTGEEGYCWNCGKPLPDYAEFCSSCGSKRSR